MREKCNNCDNEPGAWGCGFMMLAAALAFVLLRAGCHYFPIKE